MLTQKIISERSLLRSNAGTRLQDTSKMHCESIRTMLMQKPILGQFSRPGLKRPKTSVDVLRALCYRSANHCRGIVAYFSQLSSFQRVDSNSLKVTKQSDKITAAHSRP